MVLRLSTFPELFLKAEAITYVITGMFERLGPATKMCSTVSDVGRIDTLAGLRLTIQWIESKPMNDCFTTDCTMILCRAVRT